jgi:hypothetical protein
MLSTFEIKEITERILSSCKRMVMLSEADFHVQMQLLAGTGEGN